jgi:hypothetical protein
MPTRPLPGAVTQIYSAARCGKAADFNENVMRVGLAGGTLAYENQELTLHRSGEAAISARASWLDRCRHTRRRRTDLEYGGIVDWIAASAP